MTVPTIAERGPHLPSSACIYRTIGPFSADSIPAGLLRRHDIKPGVWGLLSVTAGSVRFCWDDAEGGMRQLVVGDVMLVPPQVPHHLERTGAVTISIAFCTPSSPSQGA
ncbi:MAG: DUF1971 domain-containing protein [Sphingopyxis sp.]|uniref:DUF1971 domain-containing protein n=1 Tax=Sphingopyxis sp. TaxID=1908224 RepID=UPI002ABCECC1|nr:DUF1971 domain-containing protein [Sphingopyxis sp.]MDZ3830482.1 DUF1971 domain-containing protein [Sphingopyxis sp.]